MSVESDVQAGAHAAPAPPAPVGNPALLGLATFLPGALSLGLWLIGYLPAADLGGLVPALVFASGLGLLVSTVWAYNIGNSLVAALFGTFATFWISVGVLIAALTNGWLGLDAATSKALTTFVLSWLVVFVALTLATLRLPLAFTAGFVAVDITVALVLAYSITATQIFATIAGIGVFVFCAIFAYIWFDGMGQELGAKPMSMGSPMMK